MSTTVPREIIRWLQTLDLSFPVKQPKRDLSNGYTIAEICSRYWPDVPMHSFSNQLSVKNKESNWFVLRKVFCMNGFVLQTVSPYPNPSPSMKIALRKGMSHEETEFDDLLVGTMNTQEGSALTLLELLYTGLTKKKIQTAAPLEPEKTLDNPPPFIKTNAVEEGYIRQSGAMLSQREIQEKEANSQKSADERKRIEEAKKAEELAKFKTGMSSQGSGGGRIAASLVKKQVEAIKQAPKDSENDPGVQFSEVTVKALPANLLARYGGATNEDGGGNRSKNNRESSSTTGGKSRDSKNGNNVNGAAGFRQDSQSLLGYLSNECLGRVFAEELQQDIPATWNFTSDTPCLFTYLVKHTDSTSPLMDTLWERLAARIPSIATVVMSTPSHLGELLECFLVTNNNTNSNNGGFQYPVVPLRRKVPAAASVSGEQSTMSSSMLEVVAVPLLESCTAISDALRHSLKKRTIDTTRQSLKIRFSAHMPHHAFLSALLALISKQASFRVFEVLRQFAGPYLVERLDSVFGPRWPFEVTLGYSWVLTQLLQVSVSVGATQLEMSETAAMQMLRLFSCLLDSFGGNSKDSRYVHIVDLVSRSTLSHASLLHNKNAYIASITPPTTNTTSPPSSSQQQTRNANFNNNNNNTSYGSGPQLSIGFAHPTLSEMLRHSVTNILSFAPKADSVLRGISLLEVWATTLPPSLWLETFSPASSTSFSAADGSTSSSSQSTLLFYLCSVFGSLVTSATGKPLRTSSTLLDSSTTSFVGRLQGDHQWMAAIRLLIGVLKTPWLAPNADYTPPNSWPVITATTESHPLEHLRAIVLEAVDAILGSSSSSPIPFLAYPIGRGSAPPITRLFAAHTSTQVLHNINALLVCVYGTDAAEVQIAAYADILFAYLTEVDAARPDLAILATATRSLADPQAGPPSTTMHHPSLAVPLLPSSTSGPPVYVFGANQGPASSIVYLLDAVTRASKNLLQTSSAASRVVDGGGGGNTKKSFSSASSASGGAPALTTVSSTTTQPTHHTIVKDGQVPAATTFILTWSGRLLGGLERSKQGISPVYRHLQSPPSYQEDERRICLGCDLPSDTVTRWWRFMKEDLGPHAMVILHANTLLHQRRSAQAPVDAKAEAILAELVTALKQSVIWAYAELSGLRRALPAGWAAEASSSSGSALPFKSVPTAAPSSAVVSPRGETAEQLAAREQAALTWFSSNVSSV